MDEFLKLLLADVESAVGKLMEIAPQVWAVYVMQVRVQAVKNLLWMVFVGLCQIPLIKLFQYSLRGLREGDRRDRDEWLCGMIIEVVAMLFVLFLIFTLLDAAVCRFLNPNYYAIMGIFRMIKGD